MGKFRMQHVLAQEFGIGKSGVFINVHLLEVPESLEILEIPETPQRTENGGDADHVLEILENLEL